MLPCGPTLYIRIFEAFSEHERHPLEVSTLFVSFSFKTVLTMFLKLFFCFLSLKYSADFKRSRLVCYGTETVFTLHNDRKSCIFKIHFTNSLLCIFGIPIEYHESNCSSSERSVKSKGFFDPKFCSFSKTFLLILYRKTCILNSSFLKHESNLESFPSYL